MAPIMCGAALPIILFPLRRAISREKRKKMDLSNNTGILQLVGSRGEYGGSELVKRGKYGRKRGEIV